MRQDDDFMSQDTSERQKYLADLERLRKIRQTEKLKEQEKKRKTASDYIEDYYYDNEQDIRDSYEDMRLSEYDEEINAYDTLLAKRSSSKEKQRNHTEKVGAASNRPRRIRLENGKLRRETQNEANEQKSKTPKTKSSSNIEKQKIDSFSTEVARREKWKQNTSILQPGLKLADISQRGSGRIQKPTNTEAISKRENLKRESSKGNISNGRGEKARNIPLKQSGVQKNSKINGSKINPKKNINSKSKSNNTVNSQNISKNPQGKTKNKKTPKTLAQKVKKFISNTLKVAVILLLFFVGFLAYSFYTKQEGYYTIAVFGVDSRDGNVGKGALSDVNIICNVNRETGAIQLVSIYRDLYTEIDGKGTYHKLNEAYFKGGPSQAVGALERNLDLDIQGYATFNWKAVVDAINILGGIDIEITDAEFKYINGFITSVVENTGVGSVHLEHAGMNHLDGVQAVAYARLRLMDTDFKRTERQRTVIRLAFEKAKQADFKTRQELIMSILPQTSTSLAIDDILPFAKDIKKYYLSETTGFPFELAGVNIARRDCVVPVTLKSNVIELHRLLYGEESPGYIPSQTLRNISKKIIKDSGKGSDTDTEIEIQLDKGGAGGIGEKNVPKSNDSKKSENLNNSQTIEQTTSETVINTEAETTKSIVEPQTTTEPAIVTTEAETIGNLVPETTVENFIEDQGDAGVQDEDIHTPNPNTPGELDEDINHGPGV